MLQTFKKLMELLIRVPQSLQLRTKALSFFPGRKEFNSYNILGCFPLNYPLLQGVHFNISQTKLLFSEAQLKDNVFHIILQHCINQLEVFQFSLHCSLFIPQNLKGSLVYLVLSNGPLHLSSLSRPLPLRISAYHESLPKMIDRNNIHKTKIIRLDKRVSYIEDYLSSQGQMMVVALIIHNQDV